MKTASIIGAITSEHNWVKKALSLSLLLYEDMFYILAVGVVH